MKSNLTESNNIRNMMSQKVIKAEKVRNQQEVHPCVQLAN